MAQAATDTIINFPDVTDLPDKHGELLQVYFNLSDATRHPNTTSQVKSATITLDQADGGPIDAKVDRASTPINLVIALDTSRGSESFKSMQQVATDLVNGAPNDSHYAIINFASKVTVVQDWTQDKNRVLNAITQPLRGDNTCLFDAVKQGVDMIDQLSKSSPGPLGRRAVVVITNKKDTNYAGTKPCSTAAISDVIKEATDHKLQVPIYSVGVRTYYTLADTDLLNMSNATGGIASIGTDFKATGKVIVDALGSQMVATATIAPRAGDHNATLSLVLNDGTPNPAATIFTSPNDYSIKPTGTPTITPTPIPPTIILNPIQEDDSAKQFFVTIQATGQEQIKEFHIDLINANGTLQQEIVTPSPLKGPVNIPIGDLLGGDYTISVVGVDFNGQIIAKSTEQKVRFVPTPTPSLTPTGTAEPISATIQSIAYDDPDKKGNIIVSLVLSGQDQISKLSATISNAQTGIVVQTFDPLPVDKQVTLSLQDIPGGSYNIIIYTYTNDPNRQPTFNSARFTHTLIPTPTLTVTPSPTVVIPSVALGAPAPDTTNQQLVFSVQAVNQQLIASYKLQLINQSTNLVQKEYSLKVPPYDKVAVPFADLTGGKYTVALTGLNAQGQIITQASTVSFEYTPPTATPTMTPTPTETPEPTGLIPSITKAASDPGSRPIVFIVFAVVILALAGGIFTMLRRGGGKKAQFDADSLRPMTGAVDIRQVADANRQSQSRSQSRGAPPVDYDRDKTGPAPIIRDRDATSPVPYLSVPTATLLIESSRDSSMAGQRVTLANVPFTIGRLKRDLNFNNDDNVSREHAEIIYENDSFYIVDKGSTHHTYVDEAQLQPNVPKALHNDSAIRLGTGTVIRFKMDDGGYYSDRTGAGPIQK